MVDGVTVSHTCGVEGMPVVVDRHGSIGDFIASVGIYVAYAQVVVALSRIARVVGRVE